MWIIWPLWEGIYIQSEDEQHGHASFGGFRIPGIQEQLQKMLNGGDGGEGGFLLQIENCSTLNYINKLLQLHQTAAVSRTHTWWNLAVDAAAS